MNYELLLIVVVLTIFLAAIFLPLRWRIGPWPTPRGGPAGGERPPASRPDDPDRVDEAGSVVSAIGGQIRPGDAVTVQVNNPGAWGLTSFDLDVSVGATSRIEFRDTTGVFSFMAYWMPPNQEASVLMIEGDVLALAEAFVGQLVRDEALVGALRWRRDQYLADTEPSELDYDLSEHGLDTWTAFAARDGGAIRVEQGTAALLPAGAAGGGLPYRDFTLFQGSRSQPGRLRLVEVGADSYVVRGEVVPLSGITILRRTAGA